MKHTFSAKRVLVVVVTAAVLMIAVALHYVSSDSPHPGMGEYSRVVTAAKSYGSGLRAQGLAVPDAVTLEELLKKGLLNPADVKGFDGMQVTVSLKVSETQAQEAIMRVRLPDGSEYTAIGDGSVQQTRR